MKRHIAFALVLGSLAFSGCDCGGETNPDGGDPVDGCVQQALARQPCVVGLGHAVLAPEVAAVRDRHAQAAHRTAEAVSGEHQS